ncbi:hypothetical protein NEOKW01_0811 [Nematocida sp. AWRm80]|nr:hypothetical protein NEOKW01_0811 [Nematocida sp. AWRm80]
MNSSFLVLQRQINRLVTRLLESPVQMTTDKHLQDILSAQTILSETIPSISKGELSALSLNPKEIHRRVKESPEYKAIRKKKAAQGIEIEEIKEGNICLITQKEIQTKQTAPCGHSFDREGLLYLFNASKVHKAPFKCPYIGCQTDWKALKYNPNNQ